MGGTADTKIDNKLLLVIMINYLEVQDTYFFVGDTAMANTIQDNENSHIEEAADDLTDKFQMNRFQINQPKCKVLRIAFCKHKPISNPLSFNSDPLSLELGVNPKFFETSFEVANTSHTYFVFWTFSQIISNL